MDQANAASPPPASEPSSPRKRRTNVPISMVVGIVCLGLGIAGGLVLAEFVNARGKQNWAANGGDEAGAKGDGAPGASGAPGGKGGGKGGKGGGKGGGGKAGGFGSKGGEPRGGGGGPSARTQLVQLVTKLDALTAKPLAVQLTPEQKKEAHTILADLETRNELDEAEAEGKLKALLKLLEGQKDPLMAAGFAWPGATPPGPPGAPPANANVFRAPPNADHLKSLQTTLAK